MDDKPYRALAAHLDKMPGGFAPSDNGAHLRLLQYLFTPDEAALAVHVTLEAADADTIAERAGLAPAVAAARLDAMTSKGVIYATHPENGPTRYQAIPWVVGIWEFQVKRLSPEFLAVANDYWSSRTPRERPPTIAQMRTIPVGESVPREMGTLPYQRVEAMVDTHDTYAVAPCICRKHARLEGQGCDAPEESCLVFGDCPMDAFSEAGDRVAHNPERCIGCGLCITTCPAEALTLRLKPGADVEDMPATFGDTWRVIAEQQAGE